MSKLGDYQRFIESRECPVVNILDSETSSEWRAKHALRGLLSETGELADAIKKNINYNLPLNIGNVVEELGDLCFYTVLLCNVYNIKPYQIGLSVPNQAIVEGKTDIHWLDVSVMKMSQPISNMVFDMGYKSVNHNLGRLVNMLIDASSAVGVPLDRIIELNIDKLTKRYKEKFTQHECQNRDVTRELSEIKITCDKLDDSDLYVQPADH